MNMPHINPLENDPAFVMSTAAEALDLLAQYSHDFTRPIDRDEVAILIGDFLQDYLDM